MTRLDHQPIGGEADPFVALLLGARARLECGARLLAVRTGASPGAAPVGPHAVLLAALGWIALERRLAEWLRDAAAEPRPPAGPTAAPPRAGLLR